MKANLLLVDDDQLFLMLNKQQAIFANFHPNPITFLKAPLALEWLIEHDKKQDKTLILLDINMPDMNGWEFMDAINKLSLHAEILVVLVSSSTDPLDIEKSKHYKQVVAYIEKPMRQPAFAYLKELEALQSFF